MYTINYVSLFLCFFFYLQCWESCTSIAAQSRYTWSLRIASMVKQEFLVATHITWGPTNMVRNCRVTWEVYGGGLMGNLLTESYSVELSLWPDTKYRVQVTCRDKVSIFVSS